MNKVTIEEVKSNMQDVICNTAIEFDKPVTYVTVRMKNGFTLRESTTCVDPDNYDEEIGKEICLKKLEDKVWFLLGYTLQDKVYKESNTTFVDRLLEEYNQLSDKVSKLEKALGSDGFIDKVGIVQFNYMKRQYSGMCIYLTAIKDRCEDLKIKVD